MADEFGTEETWDPATGLFIKKRRTTDIVLPKDPTGPTDRFGDAYRWTADTPDTLDVVNWPSPETRGPVGPPSAERKAQIAAAITPQRVAGSSGLSPGDAIGVLRRAFGAFDPRYSESPASDPSAAYGDPGGALALNALREGRAGELEDRVRRAEAAAFLPTEGYVQGEPGRRTRSNASALMDLFFQRGNLEQLGGEMAADPFTGTAEQQRVRDVQDALDKTMLSQRPEVAAAADAAAKRNAFAEFLKQQGIDTGKYAARVSPEGRAAAEIEQQIAGVKKAGQPQTYFDAQGKAHTVRFINGVPEEVAMPFESAGKTNPTTPQTRDRQARAGEILPHFARANDLLNEAEAKGVLGPLAGRTIGEFLAHEVGSTGDPDTDRILAALQMNMTALSSGFASLHGRGGANVGIAHEMSNQLNKRKMTADAIRGALYEMQDWTRGYAEGRNGDLAEVGAGGAPGGARPAAGSFHIKGPNGESGWVPAGTEVPAGWKKE